MTTVLRLLWATAYAAFIWTYVAGLLAEDFDRVPRWTLTFKREVFPFVPFVVMANLAIIAWGDPPGSNAFNYALTLGVIVGWLFDRDDDDRWKRRRKALTGRVRSLGHRLAVEAS